MNYVFTVVELGNRYTGAHYTSLFTFVLFVFETLYNKHFLKREAEQGQTQREQAGWRDWRV